MTAFFYDSWITVIEFLIPGIFLGAVYDIFRLIRISRNDSTHSVGKAIQKRFFQKSDSMNDKQEKTRISEFIIVFVEDILFFTIAAITEILALFYINAGEIRIYYLMISAIGFFAYQRTFGNIVLFFSKQLLYLIRKIIYFIACFILIPSFFFVKKSRSIFDAIVTKRKKCKKNN